MGLILYGMIWYVFRFKSIFIITRISGHYATPILAPAESLPSSAHKGSLWSHPKGLLRLLPQIQSPYLSSLIIHHSFPILDPPQTEQQPKFFPNLTSCPTCHPPSPNLHTNRHPPNANIPSNFTSSLSFPSPISTSSTTKHILKRFLLAWRAYKFFEKGNNTLQDLKEAYVARCVLGEYLSW